MSEILLDVFIPGRARTKGSLKVITPRGQKPRMVEDHEHSKPWRTRMVNEMILRTPGLGRRDHVPYAGPVTMYACFRFDRTGETALASPRPTVNAGINANGDLDKLVRNLLDALQDAKVIKNDAQVCRIVTEKRWVSEIEPRAGVQCLVGLL